MKLLFLVLVAMTAATASAAPDQTYAQCCAECEKDKTVNINSCTGRTAQMIAACKQKWADSAKRCTDRCKATEIAQMRRNEQRSRDAVDRAMNRPR